MTGDPPEIPAVVVERKRGFSLVWIVPLLAAAIGAWLWWDAVQQRGPEITIQFQTADDLEAGKTKIRFKSVEVGEVETVALKPDLSGVVVTARMGPKTHELLKTNSRFWVVRPRIGLAGVSGLGTLLSGAYLAIDPGLGGKPSTDFVGLEEPPETPAEQPGLRLTLQATTLGSVSIGSPVFYHGVIVGKVEGYHLAGEAERIDIDAYISPEFAQHVHQGSRFWNASGIDFSFGAEGIKFTSASLVSLIAGGIEFDTPPGESSEPAAPSGAIYHLYADHTASREVFKNTREYVLYFRGSVRGLAIDAPVELRGIRLGTVLSFGLEDKPFEQALTRVVIALEPERIGRGFTDGSSPRQRLDELIAIGARARLSSSSLLTGALFVDLIVDPASTAQLRGTPDEMEIPTVPSTAEALASTMDEFPTLVADARRAISGVANLVNSPDAQAALGGVRGATVAAQQALQRADELFASIQQLLAQQSSMEVRLASALEEIADGMRSIRHLAETLDRQPEALLKGKSPSAEDR